MTIFTAPLTNLNKLWDKTAEAKIPDWLKAILLTLITLAQIACSFWIFLLLEKITELVGTFLRVP